MSENKKVLSEENIVGAFKELYELDVRDKLEKKKGGGSELDYLNWAHAWVEIKKRYPDADYKILRFGEMNLPYVYDPNTGYMVFLDTTINGITHSMWLPVMDSANKAMKAEPYTYKTRNGEKTVESASMFDINKTIMRCLVKCLAMHGLGLSLYFKESVAPETKERLKKEKDRETAKVEASLKNLQSEIVAKAKKLIENGIDSGTIYAEIEKISGKKNPNSIKNVDKCNEVLELLKKMKVENKK